MSSCHWEVSMAAGNPARGDARSHSSHSSTSSHVVSLCLMNQVICVYPLPWETSATSLSWIWVCLDEWLLPTPTSSRVSTKDFPSAHSPEVMSLAHGRNLLVLGEYFTVCVTRGVYIESVPICDMSLSEGLTFNDRKDIIQLIQTCLHFSLGANV